MTTPSDVRTPPPVSRDRGDRGARPHQGAQRLPVTHPKGGVQKVPDEEFKVIVLKMLRELQESRDRQFNKIMNTTQEHRHDPNRNLGAEEHSPCRWTTGTCSETGAARRFCANIAERTGSEPAPPTARLGRVHSPRPGLRAWTARHWAEPCRQTSRDGRYLGL